MKKLLFIGLLFAGLLALGIEAKAQATKITLSDKTEIVDGHTFYLHTIEKGQTLYGLTKAYGVSEAVILKYNEAAKEGLKTGQVLRIPKLENVVDMSVSPKDTIPPSEYGFIFHQVKAGETLYRIMKQYKVSLDNLKKYNSNLSSNLQIGQWIKIPTDDILIKKQAEDLYDSLFFYTLKKRDTYYRLNKKYHIGQVAVEQLNPKLKETGLQKGVVIQLPYYKEKPTETSNTIIELVEDTLNPILDSVLEKEMGCDSTTAKAYTYKIALMMPFFADLEADIRIENEYFMKPQSTYPSFRYIQYYEGFLMALDSIKNMGFKAEVYVYDTKADTSVTKKLILKPEFETLDLIIGPFFKRNLIIVANAAAKHNIKVVSPFSSQDGLSNYPNLFIPTTSNYNQLSQSIKFLSDSLPNARIMILHNGKTSEVSKMSTIKNLVKKYSLNGNLDTNNLHIYNYKESGFSKLMADLDKDNVNVIINLVNDEAYISSFVRQLNQLKDKFNIVLLGNENQWSKFKTLENEYLVNLHLTLTSTGFIDYRQNDVQEFVHLFYDKYQTDPNLMAFKGFDQSYYFMSKLFYLGTNFSPCISNSSHNALQNQYNYQKTSQGCWINTYSNIYQYNDFQLIDKKRDLIPYQPKPTHENTTEQEDKPIDTKE